MQHPTSVISPLLFLFSSYRSVSPLRNVARMCVGIGVVWQPVMWMERKVP